MASRKFVLGGAAVAALFSRLRRRPEPPEHRLEDEAWDEVGAQEVHELREDLRRELERLARGDIKASRTRRESTSPPG